MAQERYLQQLRSSVQSSKESAVNAINSQLAKSGDGSFILGRYLDSLNGVRTIIGVNAYTSNGKTITLFDFDTIEEQKLVSRLVTVEDTLGIGEGGTVTGVTMVSRVETIEKLLQDLVSVDETNVNSIKYKINELKEELIGNENIDTENSDTIEGAKKYADKAIDNALADGGKIETAIEKAQLAATTKIVEGEDDGDNLDIVASVNVDNSTTYTISLKNIATDSELQQLKEQVGLDANEGKTVKELITEVQNNTLSEIQRVEEKVDNNTDAITILNGTGEGSVHKTVSDAITKLVNGADESFDTLKEISDYIANDTTNAAQMTVDIQELKKDVKALNELNVVSCTDSTLIKVTTTTTANSDSKLQKTFTICADGIASVSNLNDAKEELQNNINSVSTQLQTETSERKASDNTLQAAINTETSERQAEDSRLQTQLDVITGTSNNSIKGQITSAITQVIGDATNNGKTLGILEDRIEVLETNVNSTSGTVHTAIKNAVNSLDYTDKSIAGQYVTEVSQTDGKISVKRAMFANAQVTEDGKSLSEKLIEIDNSIKNAETSAKAAATKVAVSGNSMLTKTESTDENGSVTYTLNLSDTWDCGTFEYTEREEEQQQPI